MPEGMAVKVMSPALGKAKFAHRHDRDVAQRGDASDGRARDPSPPVVSVEGRLLGVVSDRDLMKATGWLEPSVLAELEP